MPIYIPKCIYFNKFIHTCHDSYIYAFLFYYIMYIPLWLSVNVVHTDLNFFMGSLIRSELCLCENINNVVIRVICWANCVISTLWHHYYIIMSLSNFQWGCTLHAKKHHLMTSGEPGRPLAINRGWSCLLLGDLNFAAYQCTLMYLR